MRWLQIVSATMGGAASVASENASALKSQEKATIKAQLALIYVRGKCWMPSDSESLNFSGTTVKSFGVRYVLGRNQFGSINLE